MKRAFRFRRRLTKIANRGLSKAGMKLVLKHQDELLYQHDYGAGGMETYREIQIHWNKAKFDRVSADDVTLSAIADDIRKRGLARNGLCHGARNGWEVGWLKKELGCPVIGTDIAETAESLPDMVCHDFHEVREDWVGQFSFIFTNSLDQAFDPRKALEAWAGQLTPEGRIYIEHSMQHSAAGASEMDPFGAHPMIMPYLLFEWGKGKYRLDDILHVVGVKHRKGRVWVFVIAPV